MIFIDGNCRNKKTVLWRAGWAVVQVAPDGAVQHAAYGPVPADACPPQSSSDAEDYAADMVIKLCVGEYEVWCDNAGTMGKLRSPRNAAGILHLLTHLWSAVAMEAPDGIAVHKILGHATCTHVERGLSTVWERRAKGSADAFCQARSGHARGYTASRV